LPTLLHGPGCNLCTNGRICNRHGLRCYGNI